MDKYEYKLSSEEIKRLISEGRYEEAAKIADTIDWRRVRSVRMLCTISDLYKINRRFEDARDMLLLAYERRPGGRTICYSLCELSIKMEDILMAQKYLKEFEEVAPRDAGRFVLQYKMYVLLDMPLEDRIAVLERLKEQEYREKWLYELAYLYHRIGLETQCVEECDKLIVWFGQGRYVIRAMELKMLHQPLTEEQQRKYDHRFDPPVEELVQAEENSDTEDPLPESVYGQEYDAFRPEGYAEQAVYSEEYLTDSEDGAAALPDQEFYREQEVSSDTKVYPPVRTEDFVTDETEAAQPLPVAGPQGEPILREQEDPDDLIQVKTVDVGQYNTINLQAEIAAGLREVLGDENGRPQGAAPQGPSVVKDPVARSIMASMYGPDEQEESVAEQKVEEIESTEVFFGATGEMEQIQNVIGAETAATGTPESDQEEAFYEETEVSGQETVDEFQEPIAGDPGADDSAFYTEILDAEHAVEAAKEDVPAEPDSFFLDHVGEAAVVQKVAPTAASVIAAEPPKNLAGVLSQESDGQISLVLPRKVPTEKQITGQMNIQDILAEWERMKRESETRRQEQVRENVARHTGPMFTEFEEAVRDGILEQLERNRDQEEFPEEAYEEGLEEAGYAEEIWDAEDTDGAFAQNAEDADGMTQEYGAEAQEFPEEAAEETEADAEAEVQEFLAEATEETESGAQAQELVEEAAEETESGTEAEDAKEAEAQDLTAVGAAESGEDTETAGDAVETAAADKTVKSSGKTAQHSRNAAEAGASSKSADGAQHEPEKHRTFTREERELYAPYVQSKNSRTQLLTAIDRISMAAYTGNVIITGEEGMDTLGLAKNMIREVQSNDSNFSGNVAKISGESLNKKDVRATLEPLKGGALIIQKASKMTREKAMELYRFLQNENIGIIVFLEDTKRSMNHFLSANEKLRSCFNARVDLEALSNDDLVSACRKYALDREYTISDLGELELHSRIEERQTSDHVVTVMEVRGIMDDAIRHVNRKTLRHFFDILLAKRYDEEDMIVLTERDFV